MFKISCRNPYSTVEVLKRTLKREWGKLPMDVLETGSKRSTVAVQNGFFLNKLFSIYSHSVL